MRLHRLALLLLPFLLFPQTGITAAGQQKPSQQMAASPQVEEMPAQMRAEMEEGIKHVLVSQVEAWNHGNLEGFMQ